MQTLKVIQKFFPQVENVKDGTESVQIAVTSKDASKGRIKEHTGCAMAIACKRFFHADGVVVSVSAAYIVQDKQATRYRVPAQVSREIVSFDTKKKFIPGVYELHAPKSHALGKHYGGPSSPKKGGAMKSKIKLSQGIRVALGSAK